MTSDLHGSDEGAESAEFGARVEVGFEQSASEPKFADTSSVPGLPDVYTDVMQLQTSAYTFNLAFYRKGIRAPGSPDPPAEPQAIVRMSPEHAKSLLLLLAEQITHYEAQMGTIPVPPNLRDRYEALTRPSQPGSQESPPVE